MYSNISRIILFNPHLLTKIARTNDDICDYIYDDPFSILVLMDLKHKFLHDSDYNDPKYDIIRNLDSRYFVFSHLKANPRPVMINNYTYIQFDSKYPSLANNKTYACTYLKEHPNYITDFLVDSLSCEDELKDRIEKYFFDFIISRDTDSQFSDYNRSTNWVLPNNIRHLFNNDFLDRHDNYYMNLKRKNNSHQRLIKSIVPKDVDIDIDEDWYKKINEIEIKNVTTTQEMLDLISIAKEFINESGGYVSGSAALAFFNFFNNNAVENFRPEDIDVVINSKEKYNECVEKYGVAEIVTSLGYKGELDIDKIGYMYYKGMLINLIVVNNPIEEHVNKFDFEFCRLLWDGENFDKSSRQALASAKYRKSYFNTNGSKIFDPDRYMKYVKRGYEIILY